MKVCLECEESTSGFCCQVHPISAEKRVVFPRHIFGEFDDVRIFVQAFERRRGPRNKGVVFRETGRDDNRHGAFFDLKRKTLTGRE